MTGKELRKMNRMELVEIIYVLQQNQIELEEKNKALQAKLDDRVVTIEKAGSLAEAVVALNGVMSSAQAAADQYLESARVAAEKSEQQLAAARAEAEALRAQAQQDAEAAWDKFRTKVKQTMGASPELEALLNGK